jgi:hypothetical protein
MLPPPGRQADIAGRAVDGRKPGFSFQIAVLLLNENFM